ncbi:hypothetical protein FNQ90_10390 [Streptomyces alkaliphilus]|uniref:Uncharacterized protein n=1 Tax=Streptomyces alkaliphilus TaxID=1472722 RepID=A0A7W3TCT5_9ACTN|nr:hypothetical protein [Streptomyces alkaliphilus]MBB0244501.1 hypothetical protein [Streptomyces alkaliphilus]
MVHTVRRLTITGALLVALLGAGTSAGIAHAASGPDSGTDVSPTDTIGDRPAPCPEPEPDNTIWD